MRGEESEQVTGQVQGAGGVAGHEGGQAGAGGVHGGPTQLCGLHRDTGQLGYGRRPRDVRQRP